MFDLVGVDLYRSAAVAARFADDIRTLVRAGRPVAITETGCATYRGAADRGAHADMIVEWQGARPARLRERVVRDEEELARCLGELLRIFDEAGVDAVFVNTFARWDLPHRLDPAEDFDAASFGIVAVLESAAGVPHPTLAWEPKASFAALADVYRDQSGNRGG